MKLETKITAATVGLLATFIAGVAWATGLTPPAEGDTLAMLKYIYEAFQHGHHMILAGAAVSGFTWAVDRYGLDKMGMPDWLLPGVVAFNTLLAAAAAEAFLGADQKEVIAIITGGIGSIPIYDMIRGFLKDRKDGIFYQIAKLLGIKK